MAGGSPEVVFASTEDVGGYPTGLVTAIARSSGRPRAKWLVLRLPGASTKSGSLAAVLWALAGKRLGFAYRVLDFHGRPCVFVVANLDWRAAAAVLFPVNEQLGPDVYGAISRRIEQVGA